MKTETLFSSKKMDWQTPQWLFDDLDNEFHFVLDAAATPDSAKCKTYYTEADDALIQSWDRGGATFCNPPYGRSVWRWVRKAYEEHMRTGQTIVMLLFSRTDTAWFHDYIYGKAEVRFLRGRLRFGNENGTAKVNAPAPSIIVIWRNLKNA